MTKKDDEDLKISAKCWIHDSDYVNNDAKVQDHCHITGKYRRSAHMFFKYLSQEFDNNVLDLVKQIGFYPYEYMSDFEKFKEELPNKEEFYGPLTNRKISGKEYEHVLNVWKKFEMKTRENYHDLYLKYHVF